MKLLYLTTGLARVCWRQSTAHAEDRCVRLRAGVGRTVKELGGDKVSVYVATTAKQDPHRIEARPSLIARTRSADLLVCTGAELEIGWLPVLLQTSGNNKVQSDSRATSWPPTS